MKDYFRANSHVIFVGFGILIAKGKGLNFKGKKVSDLSAVKEVLKNDGNSNKEKEKAEKEGKEREENHIRESMSSMINTQILISQF